MGRGVWKDFGESVNRHRGESLARSRGALAPHGNLLQWAESQGGLDKIPVAQRIALVAHTATAHSLSFLLYQLVTARPLSPLAIGWERDIADPLLREDIAACVDGDPVRRLPSAGALAERLCRLEARRLAHEREKQHFPPLRAGVEPVTRFAPCS